MSAFGTALLTTTYWHVTYFHNASRDLTATSLYFMKLSHLRSEILPTSRMIIFYFSLAAPHQAYETYLACWVHSVAPAFKACVHTSVCGDIYTLWYIHPHCWALISPWTYSGRLRANSQHIGDFVVYTRVNSTTLFLKPLWNRCSGRKELW